MSYRSILSHSITLLLVVLVSGGCRNRNLNQAPEGFAVVREHLVVGKVVFENNLPVSSPLDFTLTEIDGAPITRETLPPWVDLQRGALVPAGSHKFKVLARPVALPRDYQPKEVSFVATVENGKVYYLVDQNGLPVLTELPPKTH